MIAPLPAFMYVLALVWAAALAHQAPLLAVLPAAAFAVVGFVLHVAATLGSD